MADLEVKLNPSDVERVTRMLSYVPKSVPRIFSRALNNTATTARKESAQKISASSGMPVNQVRNAIRIIKATYKKWIAVVRVSDRPIPAIKFFKTRTRDGETKLTAPKGIEFKTRKGNEPSDETPFIQTMPSGHIGLFQRTGMRRYPIQELYGPSLGKVFSSSQDIINQVYASAGANLAKSVESQVRGVLRGGK